MSSLNFPTPPLSPMSQVREEVELVSDDEVEDFLDQIDKTLDLAIDLEDADSSQVSDAIGELIRLCGEEGLQKNNTGDISNNEYLKSLCAELTQFQQKLNQLSPQERAALPAAIKALSKETSGKLQGIFTKELSRYIEEEDAAIFSQMEEAIFQDDAVRLEKLCNTYKNTDVVCLDIPGKEVLFKSACSNACFFPRVFNQEGELALQRLSQKKKRILELLLDNDANPDSYKRVIRLQNSDNVTDYPPFIDLLRQNSIFSEDDKIDLLEKMSVNDANFNCIDSSFRNFVHEMIFRQEISPRILATLIDCGLEYADSQIAYGGPLLKVILSIYLKAKGDYVRSLAETWVYSNGFNGEKVEQNMTLSTSSMGVFCLPKFKQLDYEYGKQNNTVDRELKNYFMRFFGTPINKSPTENNPVEIALDYTNTNAIIRATYLSSFKKDKMKIEVL